MFKECADIRTADTLDLEKPDAYFHEIVAEPSRTQKKLIKSLSYDDMKVKVSEERRNSLTALNVVDCSEDAVWLIDYWCGKDTGGLVRMPFSRHIIMHVEACLRIEERLKKLRAKK